ncbi:MAG: exosortase/archaeosortase family protein [Flavobacteriales bacterium]|nr:exosortase/archaeosortase family protein [Flavobacteriales bacterium]
MIQKLRENPLLRFLVVGALVYLLWYVTYEFVLRPHTHLDEWVVNQIVFGTEFFLELLGYELTPYTRFEWMNHVGILGSPGVTIGEPCDGVILFALFATFIIAFPGPIKHKLWYAPVGILSIHLINVLRVVALAVIVDVDPELLDFNHDYTFTIIVYAFVFMLWYIWIQRFSPLGNTAEA